PRQRYRGGEDPVRASNDWTRAHTVVGLHVSAHKKPLTSRWKVRNLHTGATKHFATLASYGW
ncbi:MAG: hypothetical protein PVF54_06285, partial [Anaerolineae bacterium]